MNITQPRILVVGSFVLDQFAVTGVLPELGQTVLGRGYRTSPGGKGANQAVQLARLGARVTMVGKVGRDINGGVLRGACEREGVDVSHVMVDPEEASGCGFIILKEDEDGQRQNCIIVLPGSNMTITREDVAFLRQEIGGYDMVLLQLEIPMEVNRFVVECAHAAGVPVMLNPAPSDSIPPEILQKLTYISPNETEAAALTGGEKLRDANGLDPDRVMSAAAALMRTGAENVIITLGEDGACFAGGGRSFIQPCVSGVTAVDPTAAGDSFVGSFCYAKCIGMPDEAAVIFASHAAAITVSAAGSMPSLPDLAAVKALLESRGLSFEQLCGREDHAED